MGPATGLKLDFMLLTCIQSLGVWVKENEEQVEEECGGRVFYCISPLKLEVNFTM